MVDGVNRRISRWKIESEKIACFLSLGRRAIFRAIYYYRDVIYSRAQNFGRMEFAFSRRSRGAGMEFYSRREIDAATVTTLA